jgi:hypothetical protein
MRLSMRGPPRKYTADDVDHRLWEAGREPPGVTVMPEGSSPEYG